MINYLKSEKLQKKLDEKGFVKFQLFNNKEVDEIKIFYQSIKNEHKTKDSFFHTTLNTSNKVLIKKIHQFLFPMFEKNLSQYVDNINYTLAGFLVKDGGKDTSVKIHQDWNYVDESKYSSYSFWVSLDDTNIFNGCMQFIPGSQKFYPSLRVSPDIPDYFEKFKKEAVNYLIDVPTKAGECVMFHQGIIHASRKNLSNKVRIACILGSYPKEAKLLHHYLPKGEGLDKIEQYEITLNSMIEMEKDKKPPNAVLIKKISYQYPNVNLNDFKEKCKSNVSKNQYYKNLFVNLFVGKSC